MTKLFAEFRDFIVRGNLLQTAVAFIMGGAFGKVTESFTGIVTGLLGKMGGQPDFSKVEIAEVNVGVFINMIINLVIVGFILFLVVKAYTKLFVKPKAEPAAVPDPPDIQLLTEIRDLLKNKQV